jgi:hypothetical protein
MRTHDARFIDMLDEDQQRAIYNIEVARRVASGALGVKTSQLFAVPGRGFADSEAQRVEYQGYYNDWMHLMGAHCTAGRDIVLRKVDGDSFPQIVKETFLTYNTAKRLLTASLNIYGDIAGWTRNKPKIPLSEAQLRVYESIKKLTEQLGRPPSIREITIDCKAKSASHIHAVIERIIASRWAVKMPGKARAIILI